MGVDMQFGDGVQREVDIFGFGDGKVIAGEVKSSSFSFDEQQIARDIDLANRLDADRYIMFCLGTIDSEQANMAMELTERSGLQWGAYHGPALEPYVEA